MWLLLAGLFVLVGLFAKQLCEFNAAIFAAMPPALRWFYQFEYLGRAPDDPLWVGFTRILAFAVAAVLCIVQFNYNY